MEASDKAIGPAMARSVTAGDIITAEVYARYENKTGYTNEGVTLSMLSSLLGSTFVSVGGFEGMSLPQTVQSFSNALGAGAFLDDTDDEVPFAYLSYIIFDDQMQHVTSDRVRVTEAGGFDPGEESLPDMHERIGFDNDIVIPTEGKYIYVWVSNESENTKVWFDDLRIAHASSFVAQATDYGVWGDVIREEKSDVLSRYRYGYQGQYAERDEETGWSHFELREYDPVIGRFTSVDPAGQFYSPYMGMGNDPVNGIDPDGGTTFDQGINSKGEIVYDNGINNGNIFLVNEGYNEKITSLDQLKENSTQVVNEWVWQENSRISVIDFVGLQTKFAYPGMDFGKKENWNIIERPGKNGLTASGAVTWGSKGGKGFVGLSDEARGLDIIYNPGKKNIFFGNIYNLRSIISHEGFHFNQRTLIPASGKYFDKVLDARNWVEKGAINYQRSNKWWGKVNFQSPTWPKQTVTKDQWANSY